MRLPPAPRARTHAGGRKGGCRTVRPALAGRRRDDAGKTAGGLLPRETIVDRKNARRRNAASRKGGSGRIRAVRLLPARRRTGGSGRYRRRKTRVRLPPHARMAGLQLRDRQLRVRSQHHQQNGPPARPARDDAKPAHQRRAARLHPPARLDCANRARRLRNHSPQVPHETIFRMRTRLERHYKHDGRRIPLGFNGRRLQRHNRRQHRQRQNHHAQRTLLIHPTRRKNTRSGRDAGNQAAPPSHRAPRKRARTGREARRPRERLAANEARPRDSRGSARRGRSSSPLRKPPRRPSARRVRHDARQHRVRSVRAPPPDGRRARRAQRHKHHCRATPFFPVRRRRQPH